MTEKDGIEKDRSHVQAWERLFEHCTNVLCNIYLVKEKKISKNIKTYKPSFATRLRSSAKGAVGISRNISLTISGSFRCILYVYRIQGNYERCMNEGKTKF